MEQMGLPLDGMIGTSRIFTAVQAFTVIVAECSPEKAAYLVEQHILGGGDIESIYKAYVAAITESAFFRKLLHLDEQEEEMKPKKSSAKTAQKLSQSEE